MRAVDTNVLVRLMTRDDSRQVAAAEAFVAAGAWVPQLAVAEATLFDQRSITRIHDRARSQLVRREEVGQHLIA